MAGPNSNNQEAKQRPVIAAGRCLRHGVTEMQATGQGNKIAVVVEKTILPGQPAPDDLSPADTKALLASGVLTYDYRSARPSVKLDKEQEGPSVSRVVDDGKEKPVGKIA